MKAHVINTHRFTFDEVASLMSKGRVHRSRNLYSSERETVRKTLNSNGQENYHIEVSSNHSEGGKAI